MALSGHPWPKFWVSPAPNHPSQPRPSVVVPLGQYTPTHTWLGPRNTPGGLFTPAVSVNLAFL